MSLHLPIGTEASDPALITRVRTGDQGAFAVLYDRHRDAAYRLANQLKGGPDADDLVAEAFARLYVVLGEGGGPDTSFRAYLLTVVRNLHSRRLRDAARLEPTDDVERLDTVAAFEDPVLRHFERGVVADAFAALPDRWRTVLWQVDVQRLGHAEVGADLGLTSNGVAALVYRAREALRQAYVQQHLPTPLRARCRETAGRLGAYARGALSTRDRTKTDQHLLDCTDCTTLAREAVEVSSAVDGAAPVAAAV